MGIYDLINCYKCKIPPGEAGKWKVEKFVVTEEDERRERMLSMFSFSSGRGRYVPAGEYTRLMRDNALVMSDTPDELGDSAPFLYEACGDVLINGLGLGTTVDLAFMIPEVQRITVVEIDSDVIELVGKHLPYGDRLEIVHADALAWKPPKGKRYGAVWHDIWDAICSDNLPEMHTLHRRYGRRTDWQGSWCRDRCEWLNS